MLWGTLGAHAELTERFVERVPGPAAGLWHEMAVQVDCGRDRLVAEPPGDLGDWHPFCEGCAGEGVPEVVKRGAATRFGKLAVRYQATVTIAAISEWLLPGA